MIDPRRSVLLVAVLVLAACGGEDGPVSGDDRADLEQQRVDVRAAAASVLDAAAAALAGQITDETGRFEGCTSRFPEGYRDVRYLGQARIDVGPDAAEPYVDALAPVLDDAGFAVTGPGTAANGFVTVAGARDDIEATVSWTGVGRFVTVRVEGPCLEVDADEWAAWTERPADKDLR
jgi:hypothetical protein